jgi:Reverse transcriptase (RNA-dependent DNA polymerase)
VYIPIPKKGDSRECANNRTIALISHASKVMLKIIQSRMENHMEREMPDVQAGFRKRRGTRDQIANVRWIMERAHEYNQAVYLCFIDYSKAFDCVDHARMWSTLRDMGFPEHLIALLHNLYDNQEATVRTEQGETESFGIGKGVRQGCILSPALFNLYAERVMREAGLDEEASEGIRIGGRTLNNLRYADDVTLATDKEGDMRTLFLKVQAASEKAGLFFNIKKTKILSNTKMTAFMVNNESIEVVPSFVLLGSIIDEDGECSAEIKRRLVLGRAAMGGLEKIWKDKNISVKTKVELVKALVFPVATYGCESWTLRKNDRKKITTFEYWCWRRMLRISWTEKRTNVSIAAQIERITPLEDTVTKQKLSYFGHVIRNDGLEKTIMLGMGEGKRGRGRPRTRWLDEIREITGRSLQELNEAARDRNGWRKVVVCVSKGRDRPDGTR